MYDNKNTEIEKLYSKYSDDLYKYIVFICKDTNCANDILQNTFLNLIKKFSTFKNKSSIKTWLFAIARNECYQFFRKNKSFISIDEIENIYLDTNIKIEDSLIEAEQVKLILNFIKDLKEEIRSLMILRLIHNMSYSEISEILDKREVWARVTFLRTKKKLLEILGDD